MRPPLFILSTALLVVGSLGDGVEVIPSFFSGDELLELEASIEMASDASASVKYFGETKLSAELLARIHEKVLGKSCSEESPKNGATVRIQELSKTTDSHPDKFVMRPDRQIVEDTVAFIALNSNKRAEFVHGDEKVPIRAGSLVTFPGSTRHHTVVNSGNVKIAGPFHVASMELVGSGSSKSKSSKSSSSDTCREFQQDCCEQKGAHEEFKCCKGLVCVGDEDSDCGDGSGKGGGNLPGHCEYKGSKSDGGRRVGARGTN